MSSDETPGKTVCDYHPPGHTHTRFCGLPALTEDQKSRLRPLLARAVRAVRAAAEKQAASRAKK